MTPSSRTITFSGLMSRCTMSRAWAAPSATRHVAEPAYALAKGHRLVAHVRPQGLARHQLHGDVGGAGERLGHVNLPDVVDGHDVGVRQGGGQASLAQQSRRGVGPASSLRGSLRAEHLQRHAALKPGVTRFVDLPHPARAEQANDDVPIDGVPGREQYLVRILPHTLSREGPARIGYPAASRCAIAPLRLARFWQWRLRR